jgi:hypothetical protein
MDSTSAGSRGERRIRNRYHVFKETGMSHLLVPNRRSFRARCAAAGCALARQRRRRSGGLFADTHIPADPAEAYRSFARATTSRRLLHQVSGAAPMAPSSTEIWRLKDFRTTTKSETLSCPLAGKKPVCTALGNHDDWRNFRCLHGDRRSGSPSKANLCSVLEQGTSVRFWTR